MIWLYDKNEMIIEELKKNYFSKAEWEYFKNNWNFNIDLVEAYCRIYEKNNNTFFKLEVIENSFKELYQEILKELRLNND